VPETLQQRASGGDAVQKIGDVIRDVVSQVRQNVFIHVSSIGLLNQPRKLPAKFIASAREDSGELGERRVMSKLGRLLQQSRDGWRGRAAARLSVFVGPTDAKLAAQRVIC
jgi:hypothetical protein